MAKITVEVKGIIELDPQEESLSDLLIAIKRAGGNVKVTWTVKLPAGIYKL